MAELHIVGQVSSAKNFKQSHLLCKWNFYVGNGWKIISGHEEGQTQESCDFYTNNPVWDHPVDLHYTTQTIQNSPKLLLQVFGRDNYGRIIFLSYGVYNVPVSSGSYVLDCHTWKPIEDISICINDTDCKESINSTIYTQIPEIDNSSFKDLSNDTEEDKIFTTTIPTEIISSRININSTEQLEVQSTFTTIFSPVMRPSDYEILTFEKKEICECDLIKSSCNINCCCDIDCNHSYLSAFPYCQNYHMELYDRRYCYNRNFIQRNNTPFIFEKLANNLFCILYDNLPSMYSTNNNLVSNIYEEELWKIIEMNNYKWEIRHSKTLFKYNLSKYYQHGDILWKLHDKSIEEIEFLQSGFTGICTFKKILRYLQNWKGACIQNKLTNINPYLFTVTFSNFTVIKSLPSFNDTLTTNQMCRSNICLPVRIHYCLKSFSACNRSSISGFCMNSTCTNIVKGLKYVISHNSSAGINSIDAYFNIGNASHAFYQYFEIEYKWIDSNNTKIFTRSENPGYEMGKPIIIGVSHANTSDNIFFNRTDGFFTLPLAKRNGECDQINRHVVLFGEDIRLACSIKLFIKNFTALSCAELQNLTMHLLTNNLLNINQRYITYISKLGNFSSKNDVDWLQIMFDRIPRNIITAYTVGKRILCSGLVTSMHFNVIYSMLSKPKTNYKILGVGIVFSKEEDISWLKCAFENCTDVLDVNIISYVNFHDISKPSKYHFAGGPNLDLTLPYDFFYPFLNSSTAKIPSILIFLIMYILWISI
ncbi:PREDICTED: tectonic-3-like [Trachymyrmex septentrionalis]|uniref:tectonic-3-like n=1 Tax=Trachymyrmex septentrionalis TaxID=34720 RepID=UPI00084F0864|nr:PREDICTED: tectonic-3-like [Trachymyrmex septentrionalis]